MTKKHFEAIARILLNNSNEGFGSITDVAKDLATLFQSENPRFNRSQFLIACGVPLSRDE